MKKIITILLALTVMLSISGCASKSEPTNEVVNKEEPKEYTITLVTVYDDGLNQAHAASPEVLLTVKENEEYDVTEMIDNYKKTDFGQFDLIDTTGKLSGKATSDITIVTVYSLIKYSEDMPLVGWWYVKENDANFYYFNQYGKGSAGVMRGSSYSIEYWVDFDNNSICIVNPFRMDISSIDESVYTDKYNYKVLSDKEILLTNENRIFTLVKDPEFIESQTKK